MTRVCTVCNHPARGEIDKALVSGMSVRDVASRYVPLTRGSVQRHKAEHIPALLSKAQEAGEVAQADDLLGQVRTLCERMEVQHRYTQHIFAKAVQADDLRTMLLAIREASNVNREARGCLELLAKLLGQLDERPQINILINPQWVVVRAVLMDVLQGYPEARVAVAGALACLEAGQS